MTCIYKKSPLTRQGGVSFESRNPSTLREPITIVIVKLSSLSQWFFLSGFHVISCVCVGFSVIWLYPLLYFGAWIDSLRITHCLANMNMRNWHVSHKNILLEEDSQASRYQTDICLTMPILCSLQRILQWYPIQRDDLYLTIPINFMYATDKTLFKIQFGRWNISLDAST